ncbi:MAG: DHHA1 domain-containing protein, partial [Planctomycetota bacterium]
EELKDRVFKLIEDNKKLAKQLKSAAKQGGSDIMAQAKKLLKEAEKIGDTAVIINRIPAVSIEQAREAIDMLKKKAKSIAVVFAFADEGKVILLAGVTDDLIKKGLKAGDIVKQIAPIVGGGGGGRPQMAQAGGKNPEKIGEALEKAAEFIKEII